MAIEWPLVHVGFFVFPKPDGDYPRRGAALVRLEGGDWMVSLAGRYGDFPPTEVDAWMAWSKTVAEPRFHELVSQADPVRELAHYRFKRSMRRRYDALESFPAGLLPIGDAICNYDPLYGQGMSAACRQALALDRVLTDAAEQGSGLAPIWKAFLHEAYQETRAPWLLAAVADFADPACKGDFPVEEAPVLERLAALRVAASQDGDPEAMQLIYSIAGLFKRLDALES